MRRIAAFICAVTLASATIASAAPMPWQQFSSKEMLSAGSNAQLATCQSGAELFMAIFTNGKAKYLMVYSPDSNRIAFYYAPDGGLITEVGLGFVSPDAHDFIPPLHWIPYVEARHADVCSFMFAGLTDA